MVRALDVVLARALDGRLDCSRGGVCSPGLVCGFVGRRVLLDRCEARRVDQSDNLASPPLARNPGRRNRAGNRAGPPAGTAHRARLARCSGSLVESPRRLAAATVGRRLWGGERLRHRARLRGARVPRIRSAATAGTRRQLLASRPGHQHRVWFAPCSGLAVHERVERDHAVADRPGRVRRHRTGGGQLARAVAVGLHCCSSRQQRLERRTHLGPHAFPRTSRESRGLVCVTLRGGATNVQTRNVVGAWASGYQYSRQRKASCK